MPIRAYLVLHRTRLIWCAVIALLVPLAVVLFTSSDTFVDFGVFWNHFCGCAPSQGDAFLLLYASGLIAVVIGVVLGLNINSNNIAAGPPGFRTAMSYRLTRPMRRTTVLFAPAMMAFVVIALLPALGFAVVFGWMYAAHAPALAFFPQALRLVPAVAELPADASLLSLLAAAHVLSIYLGSVSLGFGVYALFYSQRWLLLSRHTWVRLVAALQHSALFLFPLTSSHMSSRLVSWIVLAPRGRRLAWHPSAWMLLVHYAVPVALLYWAWRTLKAVDF